MTQKHAVETSHSFVILSDDVYYQPKEEGDVLHCLSKILNPSVLLSEENKSEFTIKLVFPICNEDDVKNLKDKMNDRSVISDVICTWEHKSDNPLKHYILGNRVLWKELCHLNMVARTNKVEIQVGDFNNYTSIVLKGKWLDESIVNGAPCFSKFKDINLLRYVNYDTNDKVTEIRISDKELSFGYVTKLLQEYEPYLYDLLKN